jgi:RNA 3'-terminal phosphate cyclase (ATP)
MHLADQLILPAALAEGPSRWTTCRVTQHLLTSAWVVRRFLDNPIDITGNVGEPGEVVVRGALTAAPSSLSTDYYHV